MGVLSGGPLVVGWGETSDPGMKVLIGSCCPYAAPLVSPFFGDHGLISSSSSQVYPVSTETRGDVLPLRGGRSTRAYALRPMDLMEAVSPALDV